MLKVLKNVFRIAPPDPSPPDPVLVARFRAKELSVMETVPSTLSRAPPSPTTYPTEEFALKRHALIVMVDRAFSIAPPWLNVRGCDASAWLRKKVLPLRVREELSSLSMAPPSADLTPPSAVLSANVLLRTVRAAWF